MKLNLGCGLNKLEGFTNVDVDPEVKPDVVCDFVKDKLPFDPGSAELVVMYHTIEHIPKKYHGALLANIRNILADDGRLVISFPEFKEIAQNWIDNKQGQREFWEATIYGRQASASDFHVSLMDSHQFSFVLNNLGFKIDKCVPEPNQPFNTVIKASKDLLYTYKDWVKETVWTEQPLQPTS